MTDQWRITIVNPGADKCVDNGGENRNRYSFANGSQTPQLEVRGASYVGNVLRKGQGRVQSDAQVTNSSMKGKVWKTVRKQRFGIALVSKLVFLLCALRSFGNLHYITLQRLP